MKRKQSKSGFAIYTKNLIQILLWIIEIIAVPMGIVLLTSKIVPFSLNASFFDYAERYLTIYALYQILVFVILNSINDSKKDQTLAIITIYEYLNLYVETRDAKIKKLIIGLCNVQIEPSLMNNTQMRQEYEAVAKVVESQIDQDAMTFVNLKLIHFRSCYEEISLLWKYSILVRIFK